MTITGMTIMLPCLQVKSSHWNSIEDRAPIDLIHNCPVSKRVSGTWIHDSVSRLHPSNDHLGNMSYSLLRTHYNEVIMGAMASQITRLTIVYFNRLFKDQRKHQSSASLAFVRGIHRWPVNSPHKEPVTRKIFPFDDVIMIRLTCPNVVTPEIVDKQ